MGFLSTHPNRCWLRCCDVFAFQEILPPPPPPPPSPLPCPLTPPAHALPWEGFSLFNSVFRVSELSYHLVLVVLWFLKHSFISVCEGRKSSRLYLNQFQDPPDYTHLGSPWEMALPGDKLLPLPN